MRRVVGLSVAVLLAACQARPERDRLDVFEPAVDDSDLVDPPNNCGTKAHPFDISLTGYLPDDVLLREQLVGFGEYEYSGAPEHRTAAVLTICEEGDDSDPSRERIMALNYYGAARVDPGVWDVSRRAEEDLGMFVFAYTDQSNGTTVNCNVEPSGTVEIIESTFERVTGVVDITVGCVDEGLLDRIPRETHFTGSFDTRNIGVQ